MKLTLRIKLLTSESDKECLKKTIHTVNKACNYVSNIAWDSKTFHRFKLHHKCYYDIRAKYGLSSQMAIHCISKVADSYRNNKKTRAVFKHHGAITYDNRIVRYRAKSVSILSLDGRLNISFSCHNIGRMAYMKGECELICKNRKFYLSQYIEMSIEPKKSVEEFIGVDFGLTDIAVTSDGIKHPADWINSYRAKQQKIRSSIQSKGTRSSRRLLQRLSGRERTTATIINHTISKSIVRCAKESNRGVAIEDLTNIRVGNKRKIKKFITKLNRWSFYQLRSFLTYKCEMNGVAMAVINPAYTSKTCSNCKCIGKRDNKKFSCKVCGYETDADFNASRNIAIIGAVINQPEKSIMYSCALHR